MFSTDHAKVSQFDPAAGGVAEEDVLWFHVSVDKPEGVEVGQSAAQLGHDPLTTVLLHTDLGDIPVEVVSHRDQYNSRYQE